MLDLGIGRNGRYERIHAARRLIGPVAQEQLDLARRPRRNFRDDGGGRRGIEPAQECRGDPRLQRGNDVGGRLGLHLRERLGRRERGRARGDGGRGVGGQRGQERAQLGRRRALAQTCRLLHVLTRERGRKLRGGAHRAPFSSKVERVRVSSCAGITVSPSLVSITTAISVMRAIRPSIPRVRMVCPT